MKQAIAKSSLAVGVLFAYVAGVWPLGHVAAALIWNGMPDLANGIGLQVIMLSVFSPIIVSLPFSMILFC